MTPTPDPSVSPAYTRAMIHRAIDALPFVYASEREAAHESADALLAVGERDKAELEAAESLAAMHEGRAQSLAAEVERLDTERERDRRQIARLTEALIRLVNYLGSVGAAEDDAIHTLVRQARAVLADEEDAANG